MLTLNRPRQPGAYPDRDIACQEAVEDVFLQLAKGLKPQDVVDAAAGNMPAVFAGLARRAESVGWTLEEAEVAISELSQNLLDDMSAM